MSTPGQTLMLPNAVHFKEFYGGYTGTCGETALTAELICAEKLPESHDQAVAMMLSITSQMRALGWADANGASTLWSLAREGSTKRGGSIFLEWDYAEPFNHPWHDMFLQYAGIKPILVQLANAQALPGDEKGVHYHFVCIVGRSPAGYIVMDGDNWQIEQNFVTYSYDNFAAAVPCGLLIMNEKETAKPVIIIDKDSSGNIVGAHDGENKVGAGMAQTIESDNLTAGSLTVPETYLAGKESVACIRGGALAVLTYESSEGVKVFAGSKGLADAIGDFALDQAARAAAEAQVKALQAQVAQLEVELQTSGNLPASVKTALSAMNAYLSPTASLAAEVAQALKDAS